MSVMSRYYLHLHECGNILEDFEGQECASLDEARNLAVAAARDVMIGEIRAGRLCLACHISITNGAAEEVGRVKFRDTLRVTGL
jgi:hypothetical protein